MTEKQAARICVIGNTLKEVSEKDMNIPENESEIRALISELNSIFSGCE